MKFLALPLTFFWVLLTWVPFRANDIYSDKAGTSLIRTSAGFQELKDHKLIYPFAKTVEKKDTAPQTIALLQHDAKTNVWTGKGEDGKDASIQLRQTGFQLTAKVWQSLIFLKDYQKKNVCGNAIWIILSSLTLVHWLNSRSFFARWWRAIPEWLFSLLLGAGWSLALKMKVVAYKQFIYFQF